MNHDCGEFWKKIARVRQNAGSLSRRRSWFVALSPSFLSQFAPFAHTATETVCAWAALVRILPPRDSGQSVDTKSIVFPEAGWFDENSGVGFAMKAVAMIDHPFSGVMSSSWKNVRGGLPELTVIVPVFNEIKTVEEVLRRIVHESTPKDIVIVDDGSTDGTTELLETWHAAWQLNPPFKHIHRVMTLRHSANRGKGAAIRTAMEHTRSEFVVVQDADLEVSPEEYPGLLKPIAAGEADIVIGFRTQMPTSPRRFAHRAGVHLLNLVVRVFYGVTLKDEACCFKVLRTRDLKRMNLECQGFEFCPEVVAKAARLGLRFGEVPIAYTPRNFTAGKKLRLRDGLQAILTLWRYRRWREGVP